MLVVWALFCVALAAAPACANHMVMMDDDLHFHPGSNMTQIYGPSVRIDNIVCSQIGMIGSSLGFKCVASPGTVVLTHVDLTYQNDTVCSQTMCRTGFSNYHLFYKAERLHDTAREFDGIRVVPALGMDKIETKDPEMGEIFTAGYLVGIVIIGTEISCFLLLSIMFFYKAERLHDTVREFDSRPRPRPAPTPAPITPPAPAPVPEPRGAEAWHKWRRALRKACE